MSPVDPRSRPNRDDRLDDIEQRLWSMYEELEERLLRHDRRFDALGAGPASTFIEATSGPTPDTTAVTSADLDSAHSSAIGDLTSGLADTRAWVAGLASQIRNHAEHIGRMSERLRRGEPTNTESIAQRLSTIAATLDSHAEQLTDLQRQVAQLGLGGDQRK